MTIPRDVIAMDPGLSDWAILVAYRGSIAHGMYVPKSDPNSIDDKDVMVACVPPPAYYTGIMRYGTDNVGSGYVPKPYWDVGTVEIKHNEWDIVVYELRKLIHMLIKGNPNVLSLLWVDENKVIKNTAAGRLLRANRDLFTGRHVYKSFVGYANGQLHRMTHMATDQAYMGAKRRGMVEQFGYDAKNAAHLLRILTMGMEFLKDGRLYVERTVDNNMLLDVKRGEWTLERVQSEAAELFALAKKAYLESTLPLEPDSIKINDLCIEIVKTAHSERGE